jgi:hypothetical protein
MRMKVPVIRAKVPVMRAKVPVMRVKVPVMRVKVRVLRVKVRDFRANPEVQPANFLGIAQNPEVLRARFGQCSCFGHFTSSKH